MAEDRNTAQRIPHLRNASSDRNRDLRSPGLRLHAAIATRPPTVHSELMPLAHRMWSTYSLATQTLLQTRHRVMNIAVDGELPFDVTAKDLILSTIGKVGTGGGADLVIEFTGTAVRRLGMDGRMTMTNMAIEAGARAGIIATDETAFKYLAGRPFSPTGGNWQRAIDFWGTLFSDKDANYDVRCDVYASDIEPMVTCGTSPDDVVSISSAVPNANSVEVGAKRDSMSRALHCLGLKGGEMIRGLKIDKVFIGSCTNGRIQDLRDAARIVVGKRMAPHVTALVVPGSTQVKRQAKQEGVAKILIEAVFEWRESGCSMCIGMNVDRLNPGERCASTSNRNFEGRQGRGVICPL